MPPNLAPAHVPGSLNIGLGGQFASWAGSLIPLDCANRDRGESEDKVEEAQVRLARVGLEKVKGYLPVALTAGERPDLKSRSTADKRG